MSTSYISVIVPVYNVERYLDRCVTSLINQSMHDIEIILVDDKSTDQSPSICDTWANKDPRIKVVHKPSNEGLGMARNTGLENAKGEFVMFLDSDDTYDLYACERMYKTAVENNAQIVTGCFNNEVAPGKWVQSHYDKALEVLRDDDVRGYMLDMIANPPEINVERSHPVSVCILCINLSFLKSCNIWFQSERKIASEDTLFKIRLLQKCRVMAVMDYPFYNYYINNASLTHTFKLAAFYGLMPLYEEMKSLFDPDDKEAQQRVRRFIIADSRSHIFKMISSITEHKYNTLKHMLENPIWQVGREYPYRRLPIFKKVFLDMAIRKQTILLFIFVKIVLFLKN